MKKIFLLSFVASILLLTSTVMADLTLNLQLHFTVQGSVDIQNISVSFGRETPFVIPGNYSFQILDSSNNILYEKNFDVSFFISGFGAINDSIQYFKIPYNQTFSELKIYKDSTLLLDKNLDVYLCNRNGVCDANENIYTCPQDCSSSSNVVVGNNNFIYFVVGGIIVLIIVTVAVVFLMRKRESFQKQNKYQTD